MTESVHNEDSKVVRNDGQHRYEVYYGDDLAGFAEYEERGDETVFVHTEVDPSFGGKGLGSVLAERALDDTVERGKVIRPICPFIRAYVDKHSKFDPHVVGKGINRE
ncbi:GNAT family N-acetyltransferase [Nocardia callitridis]|uniref:GNAT family N-acetyltransferase n=1 Tax=Nocardia callitridis TaxID=648753 RepID=A0ABP9JVS4_9NOCA